MSNYSVIVPIYYGGIYISGIIHQLELCMEKLKDENYMEVLFVNDAPAAPLDLKWKSKIVDIKIINSDRNVGIHGARIKGLLMCSGEYVLFLDQDDRIAPDFFESQIQYLKNSDAVVCRAIHEKKCRYDTHYLFEHVVSKRHMLTQGNGIVSPGQVLLKKECISSIWKKNIMFHNGADDWFLWICMMSEGKKFALNDEILYEHVIEEKNNSDNLLEMTYSEHEMVRILEEEKILNIEELQTLKSTVNMLFGERIRIEDKYRRMHALNCAWMQLCHNNYSMAACLKAEGYKKVAIYGDGYLGKQLYRELKREHMEVLCFIDRNADCLIEEIPVYKLEETLPNMDVIVITVLQGEKKVADLLRKKISVPIIYLENLFKQKIELH